MRHLTLCFSLLALTTPVHAQRLDELNPGDRVRLITPTLGSERMTATVASVSRDSLTLTLDGSLQVLRISPRQITRLEKSLGVHRGSPWAGMAIGAVAGPAITLGVLTVAGQFVESEPCTASDCDSHVGLAVLLIGGSILGGIAVGSIVATRPREKWQRVSLRPTLGLTGEDRSVGVAVRIRFSGR